MAGEHVTVEVMPAGEWTDVADGDTTTDEILGPLAGATADFEMACLECGDQIDAGDHIVLVAGSDEWIHEACAP